MATNLKLASARGGNRAELAAAIAEAEEAESAAETARVALVRAQELTAAACLRLDDARVSVAEARDAQADRLLSSIKSGTSPAPDASMQEARVREIEAADDLAVAQSALAICEAACAEPVDFFGQIITPEAMREDESPPLLMRS